MRSIVAASPYIKEPATEPYCIILVAVTDNSGTVHYHTHRETASGSCFWGHYFLTDFDKAYTHWLGLTNEQHSRFMDGNKDRPGAFTLHCED